MTTDIAAPQDRRSPGRSRRGSFNAPGTSSLTGVLYVVPAMAVLLLILLVPLGMTFGL